MKKFMKFMQADDGMGGGFESAPIENTEPSSEIAEVTPETSENVEVAEPQQEKPIQSQELNSQFAAVRREAEARAEARARDAMIEDFFGQTHGIHSYAEYQAAMEAQRAQEEAAKLNVDPEFYQEFTSMKSQLQAMQKEKAIQAQEQQLSSDPVKGELFNQWKDDVLNVSEQFNVDLQTAFTFLLEENLGQLINQNKVDVEALKKQAVQEYITGLQSGNTPIEGSGSAPVSVDRTPKTFEDARIGALAMLRGARN